MRWPTWHGCGISGVIWQAVLSNSDRGPIAVNVHSIDLRLIWESDGSRCSLGEIETISSEGNVTHLEGDIGWLSIVADKTFVQQL